MALEFFLAMRPPTATAQERAVRIVGGRAIFYDPPDVAEARAKLEAHLARHKPPKPYPSAVPIRLITRWCYPYPESGRHHDGEYKITRPDTDNSIKLLKDCMTRIGYWHDDAQVASELTEKFWADVPGIYIRVEPLE